MKRFVSDRRQRQSIRLKEFDYTQAGAYFVTCCTLARECLFREIANGVMRMSRAGEIARACGVAMPRHFGNIQMGSFVIMPNHLYGILIITDLADSVGATHASPLPTSSAHAEARPRGPAKHSLGAIVGSYKTAVTRQINKCGGTLGSSVWQRNYYERIIRSERELNAIRQYMADNTANWQPDGHNLDTGNPNRGIDDAHMPP